MKISSLICITAAMNLLPANIVNAKSLEDWQKPIEKAKWQSYQCQGGKRIKVRYHAGEATAFAQIDFNRKKNILVYSSESDQAITRFSDEEGNMWSIQNPGPRRSFYAMSGGILTYPGVENEDGKSQKVDLIQVKGCEPLRNKKR